MAKGSISARLRTGRRAPLRKDSSFLLAEQPSQLCHPIWSGSGGGCFGQNLGRPAVGVATRKPTWETSLLELQRQRSASGDEVTTCVRSGRIWVCGALFLVFHVKRRGRLGGGVFSTPSSERGMGSFCARHETWLHQLRILRFDTFVSG